jgi:hypothetical protein
MNTFKSQVQVNYNPHEIINHDLIRKKVNTDYGLYSLKEIPGMQIIGKFQPISAFELKDFTRELYDNFNGLWAGLLVEDMETKVDTDKQTLLKKLSDLIPRVDVPSDELFSRVEEYFKKMQLNGFSISDTVSCMFYTPSFINHSCKPNCIFFPGIDYGILFSIRDIRPDEEVTISYIFESKIKTQQEQLLSNWGFQCNCELCSGKDKRHKNAFDYLIQTLKLSCHNCHGNANANGNLKTCGKCKIAQYCSKECQTKHWQSNHKEVCKKLHDYESAIKCAEFY